MKNLILAFSILLSFALLALAGPSIFQVYQGGTGLNSVSAHQLFVGTASNVFTAKTIPDCQDSSGNHLNYAQSSDSFSCGTTTSGGNVTASSPAAGYAHFAGSTNVLTSVTIPRAIAFDIGCSSGLVTTSGDLCATSGFVTIPFGCTISAYNLAIDAGTITVKFWKVATGTASPTSSNSISTSGVSISSGTAIHSTTVSDFTTTTVSSNDIMAMAVTSVSTAKQVTGVLQCDESQ